MAGGPEEGTGQEQRLRKQAGPGGAGRSKAELAGPEVRVGMRGWA